MARADLAGYVVYVGTAPGVYTSSFDVGNQTRFDYVEPVTGVRYYFAVAAYTSDLLYSRLSAEVIANVNRAPVLTNPGDQTNTVGEEVSWALSASDPDNNALTFAAISLPPGLIINTNTGLISGVAGSAGTYNVSVSASDGSLTTTHAFMWSVQLAAPVAASPVSPVGNTDTAEPAFVWNAVGGASYYYVRVTDGAGRSWARWFTSAESGCIAGSGTCSGSPGHAFAAGPATWSILTWNAAGYGPWSGVAQTVIDVADAAVTAPAPLSPAGSITTLRPAFTWEAVPGATWYRLRLTDATGAISETWFAPSDVGCASGSGTCVTGLFAPLPVGNSQWEVQTWKASGRGPWSAPTAFTVTLSAPATPTLRSPAWTLLTVEPRYTWDAVPGASYYYVRVNDSTGTRMSRWYTASEAGCANGSGTCTAAPGLLLAPGWGSWSALAWNDAGYSAWSPSQRFIVTTTAPERTTTISPEGDVVESKPTLTWAAVAGATYYLVRVTDSTGATVDRWYTVDEAACPTGLGICTQRAASACASGTATWSVLTWNPLGYGPWSSSMSFIVP